MEKSASALRQDNAALRKLLGQVLKVRAESALLRSIQSEIRTTLKSQDGRAQRAYFAHRESVTRVNDLNRERAAIVRDRTLPLIESLRAENLPFAAIARSLNERGIKTVRGGEWKAGTVHKLWSQRKG